MLVKLQTTDYLIYAELNKTERVTHSGKLKTGYHCRHATQSYMRLRRAEIMQMSWGLADDGYSDTVRIYTERVDCGKRKFGKERECLK